MKICTIALKQDNNGRSTFKQEVTITQLHFWPSSLITRIAHLLLLHLELLLLLLVPRQLEEESEDGLEVALVHVPRAHLLHRHAPRRQERQRLLQVVQHLKVEGDLTN